MLWAISCVDKPDAAALRETYMRPHRAYLYARSNTRGVHAERWRHTRGCGRFFNALRDTTTDQFVATYEIGQARPPAVPAQKPP